MPFSEEELWRLYGRPTPVISSSVEPESQTEEPEEIRLKRLKQFGNIIPKAIGSIGAGIANLGEMIGGEEGAKSYAEDVRSAVPSFDVGENKGWVDIGLNNFAPEIAAWMVPYLGASKIGRGITAAGELGRGGLIGTEAVATGLANLVTGSAHGVQEGNNPVASGILGTVSGGLQAALPRLPRAAALAGVGALYGGITGNWFEAGATAIGTMLPGAVKVTTPHLGGDTLEAVRRSLTQEAPAYASHPNIDDVDTSSLNLVSSKTPPPMPREGLSFVDSGPDVSHLRLADELRLSLQGPTVEFSPSNLRLAEEVAQPNLAPIRDTELKLSMEDGPLQPAIDTLTLSRSGMTLDLPTRFEGPQFTQSENPLIALQGESVAPKFNPLAWDAPTPKAEPLADQFRLGLDWNPKQTETLLLGNKAPDVPVAPISKIEAPTLPKPEVKASSSVEVPLSKAETLKGSFNARKGEALQKAKMEAAHKEGKPYVRKKENFDTEGTYEVTLPNGVKKDVFRDPESGSWFNASDKPKDIHGPSPSFEHIGLNKKEAIERLHTKYGKTVKPVIRTAVGDVFQHPPRQEGSHITSTALRDNETGEIIVGSRWNDKHNNIKKQDPTLLLTTRFDDANAPTEVTHGFVDDMGMFRTRKEALEIAKRSGQTTKQKGDLHSQDLLEATGKKAPKNANEHIAAENLEDAKLTEEVVQMEKKVAQLQEDVKFALEEGDTATAESLGRVIKGMRQKYGRDAGMVINPALQALAAGGVGGLVTYQQTKGDVGASLAVAMIVAGLGTAGVKAIEHLRATRGAEAKIPGVKVPDETLAEGLKQFAKETAKTRAGMAVGGRGGIVATALLTGESFFGINKLRAFKDALVKGDGFIADVLNQQVNILNDVAKIKPTAGFATASGQYLRGQLANPVEVQNLLNSGGIIAGDGGAWSSLSKAEKAKYPERWLQLDDSKNTNTKGDGVTVWHVTNGVKAKLVKQEHDALMRLATTPEDKAFAKYAVESRKNFDTLMGVIHAGAGPKEFARIAGTMGQYVTRSHALLSDPKYYPEAKTIDMAMTKLALQKSANFITNNQAAIGTPGAVKRTWGGADFYLEPSKADAFDNLYTPESLRSIVTQRIKEIKEIGAQAKAGLFKHDEAQFTNTLFSGRKELDEMTRVLLGEHTAPQEMIRDTMNKLIPAARSAHIMLDLTRAVDPSTNLPGRFTSEIEYNKAVNRAKDLLKRTTDPRTQREIQNQINELAGYLPIGSDTPRMGLFQGSFVSRGVHGQLDEMMNPLGVFEDVLGTGLRSFNNLFKETHLVANPMTQVRNVVQIPAMLVIGRAAHDFNAMKTAFNIIYKGDNTSEVARWAIRNGATSGNAVHGELNFGLKELLDGSADNTLGRLMSRHTTEKSGFKAIAKGEVRAGLHLLYAKPDDFVRTATFLAAARRQAKKLGVAEDRMHLDDRVTDFARDFMQRRSMDYANVPQWVKAGRQIPLLSPFLTYSHEIARITGNMAIDASKGDMVSGAGLAALTALPFLAQGMAEDALSSVDRAAWEKGQSAAMDYSRPRFKMPMSRNSDGSFNYYDLTPIMPFGDFLMMGRAAVDGDLSSVAAVNPIAGLNNSPLLNMAASQVTGEDIRTHREFRDGWDRTKSILRDITPPITPGIGYEWEKIAPEWAGGRLGVTNLKNGRTNTIKGALMRNILGVDESQVNPDIAVSNLIKSAQHDIANERQYLNDVMKSKGLSEDARQRAARRYEESVHYISTQLQQRLSPTK